MSKNKKAEINKKIVAICDSAHCGYILTISKISLTSILSTAGRCTNGKIVWSKNHMQKHLHKYSLTIIWNFPKALGRRYFQTNVPLSACAPSMSKTLYYLNWCLQHPTTLCHRTLKRKNHLSISFCTTVTLFWHTVSRTLFFSVTIPCTHQLVHCCCVWFVLCEQSSGVVAW